ncbi:hypothetical protein BA919_08925 [Helicobacter pullorum]|uniref:two-partner secretion domain-containing protein n=1 Tax=Helicobacter pullorum TaxID=35818 RepID=UPI000816890E|nr:filamentous hemagglutinin N-terminal domain-containing protein [Helicobacter pullorum]OCR12265.1 hypothetical protein BA919_08925 [Helicobacter pullorum]
MQKDSKIQSKTISKIGISIIASVLLSQSLAAADIANNALPSGGKFTHGSGSITTNGKEMNITGNNTNHIIAWGGGFNIGSQAEVNFNTSHKQQASFLNLDYTNKASQILGNLNGNGNNIYLVNPSGVLIGQNASINANKFIASTSALSELELNQFKANGTTNGASFSPVFKPNKGNIVNLGTINANHIVLIGNEVRNQAIVKENGKEVIVTGSFSGYDAKNPNQTNASTKNLTSLELRGEKIDLALDNVKLDSNTKVNLSANNPINITQSTESLYHNGDRLNHNFTISSLDSTKQNPTANKYASISDITDWYYFANGINDKTIDQTQINDFRLINDIDFSANQEISLNGGNKLNFSGNYADPNGDGNYDDAMIVGGYDEMFFKENVFTANFDGGGNTLSNVDIDYYNKRGFSNRVLSSQIGVFGNIIEDSSKAQITIKNLIIDGINMSTSSNTYGGMGGFAGYIDGGTFSNIILKNIGSISYVDLGSASFGIGGFAGYIYGGTFSNIILSNIESIKAVNDIPKSSPILMVGGFVGQVSDASFSDIVLENFGTISSIIDKKQSYITQSFVGGFAGKNWDKNSFSNIVLNNIGAIKSKFSGDDVRGNTGVYSGGFIGGIESGGGIFSNIILNNIGTISSKNNNNDVHYNNTASSGGFIGDILNSHPGNPGIVDLTFENIYLYFDLNSTILAEAMGTHNGNKTVNKGKFYGGLSYYNNPANIVKPDFSNIHLYYKNGTLNGVDSDSKDYHSTSNPNGQIFLHAYSDSSQGIKDFQTALEQQNNLGGAFESNKIVNIGDDSNPIYSFEQTTGSNITPPDSNTPNIDLGNVALEKDDFISLDSTIKEIIHEILNENYGINIALDKNGYISQETLDKLINISNTIDEILKGIESKESEATLDTKIHKLFELILVDSNPNTAELESLKQSLNFLRAFYDGDNGLKDDFAKWYSKDNSIDKYSYVKDSILKLKSFINGEGNYNGNGLINQISSINNNLKALESLKQKIKAAQKYYQEALEAKLPYETLEGIYNGMVKTINESYIQALGVLETLKGEDKAYLTRLYKEYSIKEDSGFDDIRGTFSFSGNDILSKINSIILEDKPALTPPTKEEVGDDPTKENNPNIPNNLQKIADLASKEAILILPAQEKQEAIVEDGRERGRLCIVSDNAKTNNPCMAITY